MLQSVDDTENGESVVLWCCQRSMSTLFERCIAAGGDVEIFHEVYLAAYRFGPQRVQESAKFEADDQYTFEYVHSVVGQDNPPKRARFLKDMAFAVEGRFHELPSGLHHTFLIRSPQKVVRSYLNLLHGCSFDERYVAELRQKLPNSFRQICLLYDYVESQGRQSKIAVVDADEFLATPGPEEVLKRYCEETGLVFRERMLHWESRDSLPEDWHCSAVMKRATEGAGSYDRALRSTGVQTPRPAEGGGREDGAHETQCLAPDWEKCVEECEPFYKIMLERRMVFSA